MIGDIIKGIFCLGLLLSGVFLFFMALFFGSFVGLLLATLVIWFGATMK